MIIAVFAKKQEPLSRVGRVGLDLFVTFPSMGKVTKKSSNHNIELSLVIQHDKGKNDGADEHNEE